MSIKQYFDSKYELQIKNSLQKSVADFNPQEEFTSSEDRNFSVI